MICISAARIIRDLIKGYDSINGFAVAFVVFNMYAAWVICAYMSELRRVGDVQLNTEVRVNQAPS